MAFRDQDPVAARRALAHALADYLNRAGVREAVAMWSARFEGKGSLFVTLHRYCGEVADRFGLGGREAELHLKIFRALQTDPRELPADPLSVPPPHAPRAVAGEGESGASVGLEGSPSAALLEAFWVEIETQLARDLPVGVTPARLRRALIREAVQLPKAHRHAASLWWSAQVSSLGGEWPAGGVGTALVNVMYVALAELLGPTRADQCFTQAVTRLETAADPALAGIRRYL